MANRRCPRCALGDSWISSDLPRGIELMMSIVLRLGMVPAVRAGAGCTCGEKCRTTHQAGRQHGGVELGSSLINLKPTRRCHGRDTGDR